MVRFPKMSRSVLIRERITTQSYSATLAGAKTHLVSTHFDAFFAFVDLGFFDLGDGVHMLTGNLFHGGCLLKSYQIV